MTLCKLETATHHSRKKSVLLIKYMLRWHIAFDIELSDMIMTCILCAYQQMSLTTLSKEFDCRPTALLGGVCVA